MNTTQATAVRPVTPDAYGALVNPQTVPPTPHELFDYMVNQLLNAGIIDDRDEVEYLRGFVPNEGLFVLVPEILPSTGEMMALVVLNGQKGHSWLDDSHITNAVKLRRPAP